MANSINKITTNKISIPPQTDLTNEPLQIEEPAINTEAKNRDEKGPWTLWNGVHLHASKPKKTDKKTHTKEPTESERLADILTKYGNNREGIPTLHYAILKRDNKAIDLLLKHGADPHTKDFHGADCIYYAVKANDIRLVEKFLKLGVNANGKVEGDEYKPLRLALEKGLNDIARLLIEKGIDFSSDSKHKTDYLRYCCLYDNTNLEIVELLVTKGARSDDSDRLFGLLIQGGDQKEDVGVRKKRMEVIDYLVREHVIDVKNKGPDSAICAIKEIACTYSLTTITSNL